MSVTNDGRPYALIVHGQMHGVQNDPDRKPGITAWQRERMAPRLVSDFPPLPILPRMVRMSMTFDLLKQRIVQINRCLNLVEIAKTMPDQRHATAMRIAPDYYQNQNATEADRHPAARPAEGP